MAARKRPPGPAYRIPLFDLNFGRDEEDAVIDVLRSRWISMGPRVAELEERFAGLIGAGHAVAVASGTAALHLALRILEVKAGDEVIVPSLTFVASVNAVRYVGARPVFCDIAGDDDLNLDAGLLSTLVTRRTKAILAVHYGGFPCRMDEIMKVARRRGLAVIEDASHAPLSEYKGRKLGCIGDVGAFSFFSNKNISTGEGGMLVTARAKLADKARLLRSHAMTSASYDRSLGRATEYDVIDLGYNYRMDDMRAALGLAQLRRLRADIDSRARVRRRYLERLAGLEGIIVPFERLKGVVSDYIFPILLKEGGAARREEVRSALAQDGIQTSVHFPPVHRFSIYRGLVAKLPRTESAADRLITLPMYGSLRAAEVDYVARRLAVHVSRTLRPGFHRP